MSFKEAVEYGKSMDMLLIPYEDAKGIAHSREVVETVKDKKSLGIYIGPEGGFPEEEVSLAMKAGAEPVTLGHRILRTETAGMTLLSLPPSSHQALQPLFLLPSAQSLPPRVLPLFE